MLGFIPIVVILACSVKTNNPKETNYDITFLCIVIVERTQLLIAEKAFFFSFFFLLLGVLILQKFPVEPATKLLPVNLFIFLTYRGKNRAGRFLDIEPFMS